MNAVSNMSGYSTQHRDGSAYGISSYTPTPSRIRTHSQSTPSVRARQGRYMMLSLKAVRLYMLCAAILVSFFMGVIVHMVSGGDEVQAASIQPNSAQASTAAPAAQPARQQVLVGPGDTLWSIAEAHVSSGQDVRAYIQKLKQVNRLSSSALQAGQALYLP